MAEHVEAPDPDKACARACSISRLSTETLLEMRASDIAGVREHARDDPESRDRRGSRTQDDGFGDVERPDGDERPTASALFAVERRLRAHLRISSWALARGRTTFAVVSKVAEAALRFLQRRSDAGRRPAAAYSDSYVTRP